MADKIIAPHETEDIQKAFSDHGLEYSETYKEEGKGMYKEITYSFMAFKPKGDKKGEVYRRDEKRKIVGLNPSELTAIRGSMTKEVLPKLIEDGKD